MTKQYPSTTTMCGGQWSRSHALHKPLRLRALSGDISLLRANFARVMNEIGPSDEQLRYGDAFRNALSPLDVYPYTSARTGNQTPTSRPQALHERDPETMETANTNERHNDLDDLTNERIDNLAALITVTAEQMEDRLRAERLLTESANRAEELTSLVFGGSTPSIENYLAAREADLQAA